MAYTEGIIYNGDKDNYTIYHNGKRYKTVETYDEADALYDYICENY